MMLSVTPRFIVLPEILKEEDTVSMKASCLVFWSFLATVVLTGCASVSLVDSWKDAGAPAKRYQKLLVVGVAEKMQMRQVFEEVFSAEIRNRGVTAIRSYLVTGADKNPSRASLEEAVPEGIITITSKLAHVVIRAMASEGLI